MDQRLLRGLKFGLILGSAFLVLSTLSSIFSEEERAAQPDIDALEKEINSWVSDPQYVDDRFAIATLQEAIVAHRSGNGGIGACLVRERDGEIIERGHNRQYAPYFRSDLHAEMDLLDRYEDRIRIPRKEPGEGWNPRQAYEGLVLYTSVEPCPMCLTRIINSGIKKVRYVAPDEIGGMVEHLKHLPPFWRDFAKDRVFDPAKCSPRLREIALALFRPRYSQGVRSN